MYDYTDGLAAWLADGHPGDGAEATRWVGSRMRTDVPRIDVTGNVGDLMAVIGDWEVGVVVGCDRVVVGTVRVEAGAVPAETRVSRIMHTAPPTVRPSMVVADLAHSMDGAGQRQVLVTTSAGVLLGLARRADLGV